MAVLRRLILLVPRQVLLARVWWLVACVPLPPTCKPTRVSDSLVSFLH